MMKKLLTATAIGAMLTAGAAVAMQAQTAPAPRAPLTKTQMIARADARFTALDTNKDGQLSAQEIQAGKKHRGSRMLARADTNRDGVITRAEHRAAAEARFARMDADKNGAIGAGERRHGPREGKRGGKRFGVSSHRMMMMADTNKDGAITRAEYDAASARRFERLDTNRDGKIDSADRPQRRASSPAQAPAPGAK